MCTCDSRDGLSVGPILGGEVGSSTHEGYLIG